MTSGPAEGDTLTTAALKVLHTGDPWKKAQYGDKAATLWQQGAIALTSQNQDQEQQLLVLPDHPVRDPIVKLVAPQQMPKLGKGGSLRSRKALLHSLVNTESWAIDLSWDIIARFGDKERMPREFFDDFVRVAQDEGRHFTLLAARLQELGSSYGEFPAHEGLWDSAIETAGDLAARLAVEHCVHEARGLDVLPTTIARFRKNGDEATAKLLESVVYPEEITHCAAGVKWFTFLCERRARERGESRIDRAEVVREFHATVRRRIFLIGFVIAMGTRGYFTILYKGVYYAFYRHFDCYFTGLGQEIVDFLALHPDPEVWRRLLDKACFFQLKQDDEDSQRKIDSALADLAVSLPRNRGGDFWSWGHDLDVLYRLLERGDFYYAIEPSPSPRAFSESFGYIINIDAGAFTVANGGSRRLLSFKMGGIGIPRNWIRLTGVPLEWLKIADKFKSLMSSPVDEPHQIRLDTGDTLEAVLRRLREYLARGDGGDYDAYFECNSWMARCIAETLPVPDYLVDLRFNVVVAPDVDDHEVVLIDTPAGWNNSCPKAEILMLLSQHLRGKFYPDYWMVDQVSWDSPVFVHLVKELLALADWETLEFTPDNRTYMKFLCGALVGELDMSRYKEVAASPWMTHSSGVVVLMSPRLDTAAGVKLAVGMVSRKFLQEHESGADAAMEVLVTDCNHAMLVTAARRGDQTLLTRTSAMYIFCNGMGLVHHCIQKAKGTGTGTVTGTGARLLDWEVFSFDKVAETFEASYKGGDRQKVVIVTEPDKGAVTCVQVRVHGVSHTMHLGMQNASEH